MLSILQILKKYQDEKQKLREGGAPAGPDSEQHPEAAEAPAAAGRFAPVDVNISVFNAVNREIEDERLARVREFYAEALVWARKIYSLELKTSEEFKGKFLPFVENAVNLYGQADKNFLYQCLHDYEHIEDYIFCHAVNVAFLSLELGRGMNFQHQKQCELFCAAFMHDIGIIPYIEIISKRSALTADEFEKVKEHSVKGLEILNKLGGEFSPGLIEVITQEHERMDGSGYTKGLNDAQISEFAQVVALADVYESLTHTRPHRARFTPPRAVNEILNQKNMFSTRVLKLLLERIGIFPVGTWVRLNTKETGIVTRNNEGLPLRPVVQVLFAENGSKLLQPKTMDLATNLLISIEECLESQYNPR
jgi:HD-GYP domain-containing protein (c-di-GMP phosphodiesterase class II)